MVYIAHFSLQNIVYTYMTYGYVYMYMHIAHYIITYNNV